MCVGLLNMFGRTVLCGDTEKLFASNSLSIETSELSNDVVLN